LSIIETLVVFVGIPLAVVAVVYGLVYAGSGRSNDRRYRPGRPFEFAPVWFLSAPGSHGDPPAAPHRHDAVESGHRMALTTRSEAPSGEFVGDVTGGASDRW
jgi:hypothetical protein